MKTVEQVENENKYLNEQRERLLAEYQDLRQSTPVRHMKALEDIASSLDALRQMFHYKIYGTD